MTKDQHQQPDAATLAEDAAGVYADIRDERARQDAQWGGPEHDDQHNAAEWFDYRAKFEAHQLYTREPATRRDALVKIAALAVAQIESLDRQYPAAREAARMDEPKYTLAADLRWCRDKVDEYRNLSPLNANRYARIAKALEELQQIRDYVLPDWHRFQEWAQGVLSGARWAGHARVDAIITEWNERDAALAELAALRVELELERQKDHAYRSFTNGYEQAMQDYAAGRTAGWPTPQAPAEEGA